MKITIESTTHVVLVRQDGGGESVPGRIWIGQTDSGIPVQCCITQIAVANGENLAEFERELKQCRAPRPDEVNAFPLRMVI